MVIRNLIESPYYSSFLSLHHCTLLHYELHPTKYAEAKLFIDASVRRGNAVLSDIEFRKMNCGRNPDISTKTSSQECMHVDVDMKQEHNVECVFSA